MKQHETPDPTPLSREELVDHASRTAIALARTMPPGSRVVVVATDEFGVFVGVGSNTNDADVRRILWHALLGEERIDHPSFLDTDGEEVQP